MSWQVFVRATAEADLEDLNEGDRQTLAFELFSWVESGPPKETRRDVLGVEMFDANTGARAQLTRRSTPKAPQGG